MPERFEPLNDLAARESVEIVRVSNRNAVQEDVENGARVTSEVIYRTLGKLGIILPEGFTEALATEFATANVDERRAKVRQEAEIRQQEIGGTLH